jgi:hypothetical protein
MASLMMRCGLVIVLCTAMAFGNEVVGGTQGQSDVPSNGQTQGQGDPIDLYSSFLCMHCVEDLSPSSGDAVQACTCYIRHRPPRSSTGAIPKPPAIGGEKKWVHMQLPVSSVLATLLCRKCSEADGPAERQTCECTMFSINQLKMDTLAVVENPPMMRLDL